MSTPIIVAKKAMAQKLEPGTTYFWCACGRSKGQPYCDGSHQGTGFTPLEFTVEKAKKYPLCLCKHSKNPPYCDGEHTKL